MPALPQSSDASSTGWSGGVRARHRSRCSTVQPSAPIAAPAPTKRGISWKELEEGLTTLHRLRERGLITDADYEAKKKEMLDALGNW